MYAFFDRMRWRLSTLLDRLSCRRRRAKFQELVNRCRGPR